MPARRKNKRRSGKLWSKAYLLIAGTILLALFVFISTRTIFWNGEYGITLTAKIDDDVCVYIFDTSESRITKIVIPGSTIVEASKNLGEWKLGNIYELGKNEKIGGKLLKQTVVKNFSFPVTSWSNNKIEQIYNRKISGIIPFMLLNKESNLNFADKLRVVIFSLKIKEGSKDTVYLNKTSYLQKSTLKDGSDGFIISGNYPKNLLPLFSLYEGGENNNVVLVSETLSSSDFEKVVRTIEVMGFKVVSIENADRNSDGEGCSVYARDKIVIRRLSEVLDCGKAQKSKSNEGSDIRIILEKDYFKNY